jgi:hypothetical protein
VVWASGLPIPRGGSLREQFSTLDSALLAVMFTWSGTRSGLPSHPHTDAALALLWAMAPSRIVLARCCALCATLAAAAVSALPLYVLLAQMSALPVSAAVSLTVSALALAILAGVATTAFAVLFETRLLVWVASALAVVIALAMVPPLGVVAAADAAGAGVLAFIAARWADTRALYLSDRALSRITG